MVCQNFQSDSLLFISWIDSTFDHMTRSAVQHGVMNAPRGNQKIVLLAVAGAVVFAALPFISKEVRLPLEFAVVDVFEPESSINVLDRVI